MERKNRIFKSFSTALIAIMMFTAMMPSWAYGETAGSGAAVQTAEQQAAQSTANSWRCSCGAMATGKFCSECGAPRPVDDRWMCSCGTMNKGKFCQNCGAKNPNL